MRTPAPELAGAGGGVARGAVAVRAVSMRTGVSTGGTLGRAAGGGQENEQLEALHEKERVRVWAGRRAERTPRARRPLRTNTARGPPQRKCRTWIAPLPNAPWASSVTRTCTTVRRTCITRQGGAELQPARLVGGSTRAPTRATTAGTRRVIERDPATREDFRRPFPRRLTVSALGAGTYLGDCTDDDDEAYARTLRAAIALGINLIDTASNYRCQRSERVVGRTLRRAVRRRARRVATS